MKKSLLILLVMFLGTSLFATNYTILVAPKKTDAYKNAKKMKDGKTIFAKNKLFKALNKATELLRQNKADTVNIKIAKGEYFGKMKGGSWGLSEIKNPMATLRILGGYDANFTKRAPFDNLTILVGTSYILSFEGRKPQLKELYVSGLVMDVYRGNKYDAKSNCLLKGESKTSPILHFSYWELQKLVIADNIFLNSAHQASAPLIRPANKNTTLIVRNNFMVNNVYAWKADAANYRYKLNNYIFKNNSFILNWPYNPDPSTGTAGTLEVNSKSRLNNVEISNNIFAYNVGGAINPLYQENRMPKMTIKNNLFFNNGTLFSVKSADTAAVIYKAGTSYITMSMEDIEDDFEWNVGGNVSFDPQLKIAIPGLKAADSSKVKAINNDRNALRGMLGLNKKGRNVKISNYAPKHDLNVNSYFPTNPKAKKYGVQKSLVEQFK